MRDVLHHHSFTRFGAGHNERALAFPYGCKYIQYASGGVFVTFDVALENHALIRMQGGEILKHNSMFDFLGLHAVYFVDLDQCKVALAVFGGRSEERRVGKECGWRCGGAHAEKKAHEYRR